jgi:Domain of unknown function (DUF1902)
LKQIYSIKAIWDEEAKVFISESDIIGLHIEADTIEEFETVMHDVALELILENHISVPDMILKPIKEWAPEILWQRPNLNKAAFA